MSPAIPLLFGENNSALDCVFFQYWWVIALGIANTNNKICLMCVIFFMLIYHDLMLRLKTVLTWLLMKDKWNINSLDLAIKFEENSSPKYENSFIIYPASCHLRCRWLPFFNHWFLACLMTVFHVCFITRHTRANEIWRYRRATTIELTTLFWII